MRGSLSYEGLLVQFRGSLGPVALLCVATSTPSVPALRGPCSACYGRSGVSTGLHFRDSASPAGLLPSGRPPVPVQVVPTTARHHITGFLALNIPGVSRMSGDWHQHSAWFWPEPHRVDALHLTDEAVYARLLDRLGRSGLRDARPGLARLNHPAARRPDRIWAATHERAVIEMAWARLDGYISRGLPVGLPPVLGDDLARLLPFPDQWVRLHWWAWRLRPVLTAAERSGWDAWRREWTP